MVSLSCIVIVVGAIAIVLVAEKERRISALKSEFVANVSHELKTPLALVRMFAEMLQSGRVASDAKKQEYLDIIVRESERLSALIENVLDFARLERGRGSYEFAEGDVGDAVTRAANVYRYRAEREGVKLVARRRALAPARAHRRARHPARGHQPRRQRAQVRPERRGITVRARATAAATVDIRVIDEARASPPEDRHRIFERFVRGAARAHATSGGGGREPRVRGSGIGLALVKHIAESHGGRAWVEARLTSTGDQTAPRTENRPPEGDAPPSRDEPKGATFSAGTIKEESLMGKAEESGATFLLSIPA